MKRFLLLATVAFAFSATPALAAPIPHNDDDPNNWGAVYNLDLCGGDPCEFSATSTNQSLKVGDVSDPEQFDVLECESVSVTYELVPHATLFNLIDFDNGFEFGCVIGYMGPFGFEVPACVYSPSGFASGHADIELWLRGDWQTPPVSGSGLFAKASGSAVGNYVYRFGSYEFDDQTTTAGSTFLTLNGTYDIDGDPVLVEHDRGATPCGYPELS